MTAKQKFKVVSLFSGGMGLDLGLESTGEFEILACVESDPSFCDTIRRNRDAGRIAGNPNIYQVDINNLDPASLLRDLNLRRGQVDLLVGGPPCQSFSTAGRRRTVADPRGTLLWQFLRFIETLKPKFFLMENVRGLVSAALRHRPIAERPEKGGPPLSPDEEPGSVVRLFAHDLQQIDSTPYHMDIFEVNAVNYGAPQLRERALFLGNRYNIALDFPQPTHGPPDSPNNRKELDLFTDEYAEHSLHPWRTLRDAIGNIQSAGTAIMDFSPRKKGYLDLVPPGCNWRSLPVDIQKESMGRAWHAKGGRSGWWRRLSYDLPCPTLVTMPNHASTALCHPTETRALSVREYARIQEFPDAWEFSGTVAKQYAQVGNAVPTRLGYVAGNVLATSLHELAARSFRPLPKTLESYRVIYIHSHVRTRRWYKDGTTYTWEDGGDNGSAHYPQSPSPTKIKSIS